MHVEHSLAGCVVRHKRSRLARAANTAGQLSVLCPTKGCLDSSHWGTSLNSKLLALKRKYGM